MVTTNRIFFSDITNTRRKSIELTFRRIAILTVAVNPISNKPYSLYNWPTGWTGCAISSSHSSTAENTGWRGYEKISSKDVQCFCGWLGAEDGSILGLLCVRRRVVGTDKGWVIPVEKHLVDCTDCAGFY